MAVADTAQMRAGPARSERRQPTVLFCDLVGSTELARELDPEDLSRVMQAYEGACDEVVRRYRGHVYTFEGDGFRVLFGYPEAHEDDAERAVRAGLDLVSAVSSLVFPELELAPLAVRVGVATGLVVVEQTDSEAAAGVAARGEAPTLASRLQGIAQPGWVVVSQSTRERLGALFRLDDLGDLELKGYSHRVPCWRVLGEQSSESRFAAMRGWSTSAMVGREHELDRLLAAWKSAKQGAGRAVAVSGEPGIGKSRLVERLAELVESERHYRVRYQCSPFHTNSALHPFIGQLARIAEDGGEADAATRLARLERRLVIPAERLGDVMPLVADLLSLPAGDRYDAPPALSPEQRKERLLWVLFQQLVWLAETRPVLILFEDAHWADPTSRELVEATIPRLRDLRVLMVITYRIGFELDAAVAGHVEHLALESLDAAQSRALAETYSSPIHLADELLAQVVDRAGGVPLFIEELTAWVLAALTGRADEEDGTTDRLVRTMSIPVTLQDSLMERLDQLGPAKDIAQLGAVIGREFPRDVLAALSPLGDRELADGLERLERAQVLLRRGEPGAERYAFRHALIHDQAYECLLKSRRAALHAELVRVLEERLPRHLEPQDTEVLARHCERAGLADKALVYWCRAGEHALSRSANREAIHHFKRALAMLPRVAHERARERFELDLQVGIGAAYQAARGFASTDAMRSFERARTLAERNDAPQKLIDIQRGLYSCYYVRGQHRVSYKMANEMLELGRRSDNPGLTTVGRYVLGASLFWQGRFRAAREEFEDVLERSAATVHEYEQLSFQIDPIVSTRFHLAWTLWMLGYPEQSWTLVSRAVDLAERQGQPLTLAMALFVLGAIHASCYSGRAHPERLEQLVTLTREHGLAHPAACAKFLIGCDLVARGDAAGGITKINEGMQAFDEQEAGLGKPWGLTAAALAHERLGETQQGLALVEETLRLVDAHAEYQWSAELHRVKGLLLLHGGEESAARASFESSARIAVTQEAKSLELRARTSLAILRLREGDTEGARAELAPIHAWFREGFLYDDLKEAGALLSGLE